nr:odorant-binding protein-like isoform X2 [Bubalus bubalis]
MENAYIASSNLGKIKPNGPFRVYLHKLLFDDEQGTVDFYFFVKRKGKWEYKHVTGIKQEDGTFAVDYEGKNVFEVSHASNNILIVYNINVDEHGQKTVLTGLFVKVNIEDESLQKFKELTQEKGIEEENVVNFIETDDLASLRKTHFKSISGKSPLSPWNQDQQHEDHFPGS